MDRKSEVVARLNRVFKEDTPTVNITLSGENNDVLRILYPEITEQWVLDFKTGQLEVSARLRKEGFNHIILTNGSNEWTIDLKEN